MEKTASVYGLVFVLALGGAITMGTAHAQSATRNRSSVEALTCSPAPCVLPPTQVSEGGALVNTPSIAADPLNPGHLVLGANDGNCPLNTGSLAAYTSSDGGSAWGPPFCMPNINDGPLFHSSIDPSVAYDRNGVAYVAGPYYHTMGTNVTGFVAFSKSSDGTNWSQPAVALQVAKSFVAYSWLAVDTNLGSPHFNSLYISAVAIGPPGVQSEDEVVVAHSSDGGATWRQAAVGAVQISPAGDNFTVLGVGRDGTVYLTWLYCPGSGLDANCKNNRAYMLFSKSADGGDAWSTPIVLAIVTLPFGALPNSKVRVYNYPAIGVDNSSGPHSGSLYVAMYNWTGTYLRVQVVHSTDGGNIWSKPVPVAPPSDTHDQFFPWLSVSPTGLVGVSWLDRRNDPANIDYQAFAAISNDGGRSFQPDVQLTTAFSNPNVNGYTDNLWMGDYTGNTWDGPNYFIAAWMDSSNAVDMQAVVGGIRLK